jgi:H+/Cl- antiporter ClcA
MDCRFQVSRQPHKGEKAMPFRWSPREHLSLGAYLIKWFCIVTPVSVAIGFACALFLWLLELATRQRLQTPWLLFLLPLAGAAISLLYSRIGGRAEGGNNLLMDAIHGSENNDSGIVVPRRMAPLILGATIISHLFGASVGREGTAVQMGGSIASAIGRWFRLNINDFRILLMAGIAAGFGAVFGTPLTGAVFAMEVLAVGRMTYDALIPCLMAAIIGDQACVAWGIHHTHYAIATAAPGLLTPFTFKVLLASVAFGLASVLFAELVHSIGAIFKRFISHPWLRPMLGGALIIALTWLLGSGDYLGLGVSSPDPRAVTIVSSFSANGATPWSWWWKLLFTVVALGSGFKGGEVTPLFFIGAALGNALAMLMDAPVDIFAALGFIAVFAGASNTPLACTLMGIELFGSQHTLYFAMACFISYVCSGHSGIYLSQRIATPKPGSTDLPASESLRAARELRPGWGSLLSRRVGGSENGPAQN